MTDVGQVSVTVIDVLPLFEMARMRAATTPRRHPTQGFAGEGRDSTMRWVNHFTHTRRLLGPDDKEVVTPNNDTLYTNTWLDLSSGPVVIDIPEMGERYWTLGFLDAWTNPWAYAGRRTTGGGAQQLFVHGPRWEGDVPTGMHRIAAPGDDVWIIGRILVDNKPTDIEMVHSLQNQFRILRLDGTDAASRIDVMLDGRNTEAPEAGEFLNVVTAMLSRNPSQTLKAGSWPIPETTLATELPKIFKQLREDAQPSNVGGGWSIAVTVRTHFGEDILTRARVARNWIGTLGIEEAMYVMAETDATGELLDGACRYQLRFPASGLPDVDAFWSITLYRRKDRLLVANSIGRYSIGDRTPGLCLDNDRGITIVVQATDPGPGVNWLPAPENEGFYLTLRLYQPRQSHLDNSYSYPPLVRVG